MQCEIAALPFSDISKASPGEPSEHIRERVIAARAIQTERFKEYANVHCNAQMSERMIHHYAEAIGYRNLDRGDWAERGV